MSAEYTPGPWKGEKYCVWAGDKYVAGVQTGNGSDEQRANCMLIAAAPALLATLKAILPFANNHKCRFHGPMICDACVAFQEGLAAIRQAEGGRP